jgi:hypothetical protein
MTEERERGSDRQTAESQTAELQNVRVLLEEARLQIANLLEVRRRRLETRKRAALRGLNAQLDEFSS